MKKLLTFVAILVLSAASFAGTAPRNRALATKHTVKMAGRPFVIIGHATKKVAVTTAAFSFTVFDATVVDPFGGGLQVFADGVDMGIAAPLESLPKPLNEVGVGVHYVYLGLDKVGEQLAK